MATPPKDYTGQRIGKLIGIRRLDLKTGTNFFWELRCDCGQLCSRNTAYLANAAVAMCPACGRKRKSEVAQQKARSKWGFISPSSASQPSSTRVPSRNRGRFSGWSQPSS